MFKVPSTRTDFWLTKIKSNRSRDALKETLLLEEGWRICYVWECALRGRNKLDDETVLARFNTWLSSPVPKIEIMDSGYRLQHSAP